MDIKQIAKDTTKVLSSYLTYQAVKVITAQLRETNPGLAIWLSGFSSTGKIQDGEVYLQEMLKENQEIAFRIMTVREHLAEEVVDYLPEMIQASIQQANMEHRRQYLERMTQLSSVEASPHPELNLDSVDSETSQDPGNL
ncbi:MAG: RbcX chaperonin protein [Oscillatoriales cyanobacterium RM1_1_9]|nr:RbcX chaperonin protein [Oscillatoriales cyanobacterium SM2_3_0]NJO47645.1 RbcX chaperonin protein [Oscillatoriales cyanobacterium RM2_1_1]NJO71617.1 RbcX chaperonin protein [Oscillatoriales cyanobacterium RM1_1_9]